MPALTVLDILRRSTEWLAGRGLEQSRLDAELLLAHALGIGRLDLYVQFDRPMTEAELVLVRPLVRDRGSHKPIAYIIGEREFFSLPFTVDERVLIPRPETEHLVEVALAAFEGVPAPTFVDLGTGSGCIPVSILANHPGASAHGVDLDPGALAVARANAERHGVSDRLTLHAGDLWTPLQGVPGCTGLDAVLSNPPYIRRDDPDVAEDVRRFEPDVALFVEGSDPLALARQVAEGARQALRPGGIVALEVGHESGAAAASMLAELGFVDGRLVRDLAGIDRIAVGSQP